jgi:hypothetical protein
MSPRLRIVALLALAAAGCNSPDITQPLPPGYVDGRGGSITVGNVTLDVPAGAVATATEITIDAYTGPLPASVVPDTAFTFGPAGLVFALPARVKIRYLPEQLAMGAHPAWLRLVVLDPQSVSVSVSATTWRPDIQETTVIGETTRLGLLAVADLDTEGQTHTVQTAPQSKADILFLIDDSGSMTATLPELIRNFVTPLTTLDPPLDLHLGIVTSDLGAGQFTVSGCAPGGDGGKLQNNPVRPSSCANGHLTDPADHFLRWAPGQHTRLATTNFVGLIEYAFACYVPTPAGCGFESVLGGVAAALDGCNLPCQGSQCDAGLQGCTQAVNQGFLRAEAALAVVVITNEDDCSAPATTTLFDPSDASTAELGPFSSYRCFEFGVLCDGQDPGRTAGSRTSCQPGTKEPDRPEHQLVPVEQLATFLKGMKPDPRLVSVALLAPPAAAADGTIVVETTDAGVPDLASVCTSATFGDAWPAVRLNRFAQLFDADRVSVASICDPPAGFMAQVGTKLQQSVPMGWCFDADMVPADVDPAPGLQPDCIVTAQAAGADPWAVLPCDSSSNGACYSVSSAAMCPGGASLYLERRGDTRAIDTVSIQCQSATLQPQ